MPCCLTNCFVRQIDRLACQCDKYGQETPLKRPLLPEGLRTAPLLPQDDAEEEEEEECSRRMHAALTLGRAGASILKRVLRKMMLAHSPGVSSKLSTIKVMVAGRNPALVKDQ